MTDENIEAILRAVRLGLHPERAAVAAGVKPSTMRNHRRRDEAFATALRKAEADAEEGILSRIIRHSETQWTACAWLLERRFPKRWAKRPEPPAQPTESAEEKAAAWTRMVGEMQANGG